MLGPIFLRRISEAFLFLIVLTVASGMLVPLYSDEIAIHISRSRFLVEGARVVNLLPQCTSSILSEIPLALYPGAALYSLLYSGQSGLALRALGVTGGIFWVVLVWVWARRQGQKCLPNGLFQASLVSISALGVLPYVLVLVRPETAMALGLAAYCLLPLHARVDESRSVPCVLGIATVFALLTSCFFYLHPKALFFVPFILASAWYTFRRVSPKFNIPIFLILLWVIAQGVWYVRSSVSCPDAPIVEQAMKQMTLDLRLAFTDFAQFAHVVFRNLTLGWDSMLRHLPVAEAFESAWLPGASQFFSSGLLSSFAKVLHLSGLLLIVAVSIAVPVQTFRYARIGQLGMNIVLPLMLWIALIAHTIVYNPESWHFYTLGLIIPVLTILIIFLFPARDVLSTPIRWLLSGISSWFLMLAIASIVMLLSAVFPALVQSATSVSSVMPGQPLSTPIYASRESQGAIKALARQCGIGEHSEKLVLDGFSYLQFSDTRQPINILYISESGFGADVANRLPRFLNAIGSGGVVSRCDYLPQGLRMMAVSEGKMCCISSAAWSK